jgi:hypothetical protein
MLEGYSHDYPYGHGHGRHVHGPDSVLAGGVWPCLPGGVDAGWVETITLQPAVGAATHTNTRHRRGEVLVPVRRNH